MKINLIYSITPVCAVREIEIKILKKKIRCWPGSIPSSKYRFTSYNGYYWMEKEGDKK